MEGEIPQAMELYHEKEKYNMEKTPPIIFVSTEEHFLK